MSNIWKVTYKLTKSWIFDLFACVPLLCFMISFIMWRCIVTRSNIALMYYLIFHSYALFNLLNTYGVNNQIKLYRKVMDKNRNHNGNVDIHPLILMYLIFIILGYFSLPMIYSCNLNQFREIPATCFLVAYVPSFLLILGIAIGSPLCEDSIDEVYLILFILYVLCHCFFFLHSILTKFNVRGIALFFNPFTWIYLAIISPYLIYAALATKQQPAGRYAIDHHGDAVDDEVHTIEDIVGGISAIEIFEDIERQTRPLAVIQDKILKSKTTLREDNNCCICLEPLRKGSFQLQIGCLHMFHFKCIKDWATRENTCPECRQPINVQF